RRGRAAGEDRPGLARQRRHDGPLAVTPGHAQDAPSGPVLGARHRNEGLEEAALIALGREVHGEAGVDGPSVGRAKAWNASVLSRRWREPGRRAARPCWPGRNAPGPPGRRPPLPLRTWPEDPCRPRGGGSRWRT